MSTLITSHGLPDICGELFFALAVFAENQDM